MKKLVVNIDSLPAERFKLKELVKGDYKRVESRNIKIRPGFAFMPEFLLDSPPSKTGLWMDFIKSHSPYWFIKRGSMEVRNRGNLERRLLMLVTKLLSRRTYNPHSIPTGLLRYFDRHHGLVEINKHLEQLLSRKFRSQTGSIISGEVEEVEKQVMESSAHVVFANYSKLDIVGHIHGPKSGEYKEALEAILASIERIERSEKFGEIIFMSDHGMYEIKKYLNYSEFLSGFKPGKDMVYFVNSPLLRVWDLGCGKDRILDYLGSLSKFGKILSGKDFKNFELPTSKSFGDYIFWLKRGNHFVPDFFWGDREIKGMHGYFEWDKSKYIVLRKE